MRARNAIPLDVVLRKLGRLYRPPATFLRFRTPLDLAVATILSAQCTDARVNLVTQTILYPKYRTAEDYVRASQQELERDVRTCGFFRSKARNIRTMCRQLLERHGGEVPRTMAELTALAGIGRKTANVILAAAYGVNEGIAVDTHVLRLARRLGLSAERTPEKVERDLLAQAPRRQWRRVTTLLISHGRAVCTARGRACGRCVFRRECPSSLVLGRQDLAAGRGRKAQSPTPSSL